MTGKPKLVLLITGICIYLPALLNGFTWDDELVLVSNPHIKDFSNISYVISKNYFELSRELSYRPLLTALYFIQYRLFSMHPAGYHLLSILAHVITGLLVFEIIGKVFKNTLLAFMCSLIFLVHPINTESVCSMANQEDVFFCVLYLGAFLSFLHYLSSRYLSLYCLSLILFGTSLLTKEMALTLPIILFITEYIALRTRQEQRGLLSTVLHQSLFWLLTLGFILLRFHYMKNPVEYNLDIFHPDPWVRILTLPKVLCLYILKLVFPYKLQVLFTIDPVVTQLDPWYIIPSIVLVVLTGLALYLGLTKTLVPAVAGWFWFIITITPVTNVYPIANIMAERFLYLPSIGIFLVIASLFNVKNYSGSIRGFFLRNSSPAAIIFMTAIVLLAARTVMRIPVWKNNYKLWSSTVLSVPDSAIAHHNLGEILYRTGKYDQAIRHYQTAVSLKKTDAAYYYDLGSAQATAGDYENAASNFDAAVRINPGFVEALTNLGTVLHMLGRKEESVILWRKALQINPDFQPARGNLQSVGEIP